MFQLRLFVRRFSNGTALFAKKAKRISPKNFADVHLKGNAQFITRQLYDPYVKKRRLENYRCRSAFKLLEINEQYNILKPGSVVVDLGAAPGSWSQVAINKVKDEGGVVIAIDLLHMPLLEDVHIMKGDFTQEETQSQIAQILRDSTSKDKVDVVLCDAAPKASGVKSMDHGSIVRLVSSAAKFALKHLKCDGVFLFKLLDGDRTNSLKMQLNKYFYNMKSVKPPASRKDSGEFYILCYKL